MTTFDCSELCRLCLVKDRVKVPIFEGEGDARQVSFKIGTCLPIKVTREDRFPKQVCEDCINKLDLVYDFWTTTVNSERQLSQWVGDAGDGEDKQGYVSITDELMKQETAENRLMEGSVMNQNDQNTNININMMDQMGLTMPIIISNNQQQQQQQHQQMTMQGVSGTSSDANQRGNKRHHEEVEASDDEGDIEGLDNDDAVKSEDIDGTSNRPTGHEPTFVSIACDDGAGPSGLQQQKMDMSDMIMTQADVDPKSGKKRTVLWILKPVPKQGQTKVEIKTKTSSKPEVKLLLKPLPKTVLKTQIGTCPRIIPKSSSKPKVTRVLVEPEVTNPSKTQVKIPEETREIVNPTEPEVTKEESISILSAKEINNRSQETTPKKSGQSRCLLKYSCPNCPKVFTYVRCLNAHIVKYHEDNDYTCAECGHKTRMKINLIKHIKYHHTKSDYYQCHQCEKRYKHSDALRKHEDMVHNEDEPSMCQFCGYTTMSKRKLLYHESKYHKIGGYACNFCNKRMITKGGLERHIKTHQTPQVAKVYKCEICGNTFRSSWSLRKHKILHTGAKPHICTICGARFSKRNTLKQHLLTHTGLRPYVCDICDKSFVQKAALTVHRKAHPGEHPPLPKMYIDSFIKKIAPECIAPPPVVYNRVRVDSVTFEEFHNKN